MTLLALAFGLLIPWITGLAFLALIPRAFGIGPRGLPWAILSALPLGLCIHVLLASLILLVSPGWMHWSQVIVPELLLCAFTVTLALRRRATRTPPSPPPALPASPGGRRTYTAAAVVLNLSFVLGLAFLSSRLLADAALFSHGYYDAWHIWNFKARIIAQGQDSWQWYLQAPEALFSHQEYPIGFNVLLARLYFAAGSFDPALAQAVGVGSGLLCPLLVWAAVMRAKGYIHAACAGLVTLAFPFSVVQAAWQYADAPLAALLVTTIAWHYFYCRPNHAPDAAGKTYVAWTGFGLLLGSLLWTKNEGLVMAGALLGLSFIFDCARKIGLRAVLRRYLAAFIPLAILAAMHVYIKLNAHEVTDLIKDHTLDKQVQGLINFERVKIILNFFAETFLNHFDRVSVLVVVGGLVFLGVDCRKSRLWPPALYTLALLAVSAAYFVTFLFTPYDLSWHLGTAMSRLMIQLWPATILTLTLFTAPLDRILLTPRR